MNTNRFDALTKTLAHPTSRRTALGRLAAGGLAGAVFGAAGLEHTAAQPPTAGQAPFGAGFQAIIYQGPNKGLTLIGRLGLMMAADGRLSGSFVPTAASATPDAMATPAAGASVPVTGQLSGVAINLVFYLPQGKHIFGVGTLGQDPTTGEWTAGGPLVGPDPGDSGDWDTCLRCSNVGGKLVCVEITCPAVGKGLDQR